MRRLILWFIAPCLAFYFLWGLHSHFANHAQLVAQQQQQTRRMRELQANRVRVEHESRLAWQKGHPAEYARQRAEVRAAADRRKQQALRRQAVEAAEAAETARKQHAAAQIQNANAAQEQTEVAESIHPSDLVQSFTIVDSKLGLVIDRDVWDSLSDQDKELFFNRIMPIWDSVYERHHPDSGNNTDIMLFDLNQDFVTDYDSFMLWRRKGGS